MARRVYTIGQVSRLSGIPVRRLRFYSDRGLLPPADRTNGGYRVFTDQDLVRVGLISVLREAGLGLQPIREVIAKRLPISSVLEMRLAEIEAQIESQRRVAAVIRSALKSPVPTDDDLRRIWMMMNLSVNERRAVFEKFFEKVASGIAVPPRWQQRMVKLSTPELPAEPTAEQMDAWIELTKLMEDPQFVDLMRENAKDSLGSMDADIFRQMQAVVTEKARDAMASGQEPTSSAGREVADLYLTGWARAHQVEADNTFYDRMWRKQVSHRHTIRPYWDLVTKTGGLPARGTPDPVWNWIDEAATARLKELTGNT